jgi:hypothetical protein
MIPQSVFSNQISKRDGGDADCDAAASVYSLQEEQHGLAAGLACAILTGRIRL